ncbi:Uncharacterised protein [Enterobacter asburiae]|uniref:Uncharacterized protein n=1 Tax=Enterobacter asburiae TaxID=61645 RepID=A0A376FC47_ENTAS|nr:Uncharacterised protein [Enterobacter asburiae]
MNLTLTALIRKFISYLAIYTLLIISFMLFVTVSGYYLFIFDWPERCPANRNAWILMHWT